jgi:hypothetical protein
MDNPCCLLGLGIRKIATLVEMFCKFDWFGQICGVVLSLGDGNCCLGLLAEEFLWLFKNAQWNVR